MTPWTTFLTDPELLTASAIAAAVAVAWWAIVRIGRTVIAPAVLRWSGRTETGFDDALAHALKRLRFIWGLPAAFAIALPDAFDGTTGAEVLRSAAWIAGAVQLALLVSAFVDYWIRHARDRQEGSEGSSRGGLAALSIVARIGIWLLLVLMLLDNLGVNVATLLAGLGVGGIAVGLAVQKVLGDLFAYFAILFDKPFEVGHFVIVDGFTGTVEHIGIKTTRVRSLGGELIVFGNADLTQSRLRNYRLMQERRIAFTFGIEYSTPVDVVEAVPGMVREVVESVDGVRFDRAHFATFGASSLDFEVVYWLSSPDYAVYMDAQQAINLGLMKRFEQAGIGFAFPSRTVYLHPMAPLEGERKTAS